jgi:membrane protease YdiL (CAAX protease family)
VVLTALAWAALHTQYDLFDGAIIFAGGILLGVVRLRSGSTRATFALHALWNFAATVEVALKLAGS